MPNGADKNVVRLCAAIDGFRVRYGSWPTVARLWPGCIKDLQQCLTPEGFSRIQSKLRLIEAEGATVQVEDEHGRSYDYGQDGFPETELDIRAEEWLQPERRHPTPEELELYHKHLEELKRQYPGENVLILPG